ncbi:hypothetical protein H6F77_20265 [Microcoleus sp. FACHB-831]|nr:hypothetical protein [Microcoleus sp. FACHB-831]MBD1923387.1 hypothetical protein [Microcoleus sp. FACHB-831]
MVFWVSFLKRHVGQRGEPPLTDVAPQPTQFYVSQRYSLYVTLGGG